MKPVLVPLALLLLGTGGGVAAGLVLAPPSSDAAHPAEGEDATQDSHGAVAEGEHAPPEEPAEAPHGSDHDMPEAAEGHEYVKLDNQFVVPLLADGHVVSLVLLSLAVEARAGTKEEVIRVEPKLRDLFLRVLFDHANAGRFDGMFTAGAAMRELRGALRETAQEELGPVVTDVLVLDIARQDQ